MEYFRRPAERARVADGLNAHGEELLAAAPELVLGVDVELPRTMWMRGRSASRAPTPTRHRSAFTARASAVITGPFTERAISCTARKSPGEEQGTPASITSTFSRASWCAISSFSRPVRLAPELLAVAKGRVKDVALMFHSLPRMARAPPIAARPKDFTVNSRAPHKCKSPSSPTGRKGHSFRGTTLCLTGARAAACRCGPSGRQRSLLTGERPSDYSRRAWHRFRRATPGEFGRLLRRRFPTTRLSGSPDCRLTTPFTVFRAYSFVSIHYSNRTPACQASWRPRTRV